MTPEQHVLQFYTTGEPEHLGKVYTLFQDRFFKLKLKYHIGEDEWPDIYQDFWLHILQRFQRKMFDPTKASLYTWLHLCLKNFYLCEYIQHKRPHQARYRSEMPEYPLCVGETPEDILLLKERNATVWNMLAKVYALRPQYKPVMDGYMAQLSLKEIAAKTGVEEGNVKVIIHRAKKVMKGVAQA
jgi:RNA polymerase sigma factor (sigma-70 family)